jgi:protein-S-isoprenylcysteine O-methyltransferase Ste14
VPRLALLAGALYVLVAFGWRTWLQVRRTGESGFRGFSGGPAGRAAGALLAAAAVSCSLAPLAALAGRPAPPEALAHPALHVAGLLLVLGATALTALAQLQMGDSWRIGVDPRERTALVTDGLFRAVRNPIFTGMGLAVLGLALAVPNLLSAAGLALLALGLELHVRRVEEPYLLRQHGDRYREYAARVGRFLPGIGRLR